MEFLSETSTFFGDTTLTSIGIFDAIGIVGFCIYIINYSLVTFQLIDSRNIVFFSCNIVAASCVLISLVQNFNLASALIQICWICLGLIAIFMRLSAKRKKSFTQVATI